MRPVKHTPGYAHKTLTDIVYVGYSLFLTIHVVDVMTILPTSSSIWHTVGRRRNKTLNKPEDGDNLQKLMCNWS